MASRAARKRRAPEIVDIPELSIIVTSKPKALERQPGAGQLALGWVIGGEPNRPLTLPEAEFMMAGLAWAKELLDSRFRHKRRPQGKPDHTVEGSAHGH